MKNVNIEKILGLLMLLFAIGFNLWLYRLEPTATIDPNDNAFQFGLVHRTNQIWDFATKKCSSNYLSFGICHWSFLIDHWVHNWAVGYNLPHYYSHIPQIVIVGSWRLFSFVSQYLHISVSLFGYYHIVIYLLLALVPLPVFLALRVMGLPWLTAGIGAILATHLSTDGLYGLDPSSFLWRGYGLSSQLFAMIFLPLALAYSYKFFAESTKHEALRSRAQGRRTRNPNFDIRISNLLPAVFFVTATTAGHLGIGMITMLSLGFLAISTPLMKVLNQESFGTIASELKEQIIRLALVAGLAIFLLSYWVIPTFIYGNFHNISLWDPVWKFDSYGVKETMIRLFNGDLFDFGRLPILTWLIFVGIYAGFGSAVSGKIFADRFPSLAPRRDMDSQTVASSGARKFFYEQQRDLSPFAFLFIFWLLFYFGRTTWGGLIDLIPGMKDFHLSRFIVGLHVSGMLLAPIGFQWLIEYASGVMRQTSRTYHLRFPDWFIKLTVYSIIALFLLPTVYTQTIRYNELNDRLIIQANENHAKVKEDETKLFEKLRSLPPARIFAGRGGGFGKRFQVAETPYFMNLSTYSLPTTLWLPETWSMNSDTEQYFSDDQPKDYDLYNMRWVATPPDEPAKPFWKLIDEAPTWMLYEVPTSGYFTVGQRVATVSITKMNFVNLVHLWIQSDAHKNGLFPELTFDTSYPRTTGLPNFRMTDEANYITPDGKTHNIWAEPPVYLPPGTASLEQYNKETDKKFTKAKLLGTETDESDMTFKTNVEVTKDCVECLVILKQTYHPNWKATVDGKPVELIIMFPFFIGVPVDPGTHEIVVSYEPSGLKMFLLVITLLSVIGAVIPLRKRVKRG